MHPVAMLLGRYPSGNRTGQSQFGYAQVVSIVSLKLIGLQVSPARTHLTIPRHWYRGAEFPDSFVGQVVQNVLDLVRGLLHPLVGHIEVEPVVQVPCEAHADLADVLTYASEREILLLGTRPLDAVVDCRAF